jgi:hypothetical protein
MSHKFIVSWNLSLEQGFIFTSFCSLERTMDDALLRDGGELPKPITENERDPKSVLGLLGKKAIPEEREALLKIGTDFLDSLR